MNSPVLFARSHYYNWLLRAIKYSMNLRVLVSHYTSITSSKFNLGMQIVLLNYSIGQVKYYYASEKTIINSCYSIRTNHCAKFAPFCSIYSLTNMSVLYISHHVYNYNYIDMSSSMTAVVPTNTRTTTATVTPSATSTGTDYAYNGDDHPSFNGAFIAGCVVGIVVCITIITLVIILLWCRRRKGIQGMYVAIA